ncbi:DASH family cryptochrome [Aquimarina addita]|uniref:Cryptochrome DASH n=1 Tax=Aquimarina addita TaxID=870485 RepID=A0ABP7XGK7_9FLAO
MDEHVLLWFKNDLRLHDNESLIKSIKSGKRIIPVFCFDPRQFDTISLGFPKADLVRIEFLFQSVLDLRKNLKKIGGNLLILTGKPEDLLSELVHRYNCKTVFAEKEFATEELHLIESIEENFNNECNFNFSWGRTLYHINDIPFSIDTIPRTSKAYRIKTQKETKIRPVFPTPDKISVVEIDIDEWGKLPVVTKIGSNREKNYSLTYVEGGESKALERLSYYLFESESLTNYRWTRNRSLGLDDSSKFSAYLALGCISPRKIYEEIKIYERDIKKNQSTWWMVFEIVWRDYFTFKLMRFQNAVYHTAGFSKKKLEFNNDKSLFRRWCEGRTGIPFVDAHMRQLNETGYMSNRGRVNCSCFLIHDYLVDWTWGAAYFESKLIDYDVAANWMNWHTQAYETWYTNPIHQGHKYKEYNFVKKWIPELENLSEPLVLIPWMLTDKKKNSLSYPVPAKIMSKWNRSINRIQKEILEKK